MLAPKYSLPSPVDPPCGESVRTSEVIVLRKEWRETPDRGEPLMARIIRESMTVNAGEEVSR